MSDASSLRSLRCPNCGAPVEFAPGQTSVRCRFCDSVIEHSPEAMTADDHARVIWADPSSSAGSGSAAGPAKRYVIKLRNGQPVVIESGAALGEPPGAPPLFMGASAQAWQSSAATAQPQRSSRLGCLFAFVFMFAVFAGIIGIFLAATPQGGAFVQQLLPGNVKQAVATAASIQAGATATSSQAVGTATSSQAVGTAASIGAHILVGRSGTIVPGANDGPPEAILLTTQYQASAGTRENRLMAVSTTTRKLLWQTAPLDQTLYDTPILVNTDTVFILNKQQLMAIHRTDGTVAWQATTADVVSLNICHNCLQLVGTRLAALSDDGTLEVFDAATGQSQWKVKTKQASPRGLYLLGPRLAFMDRNAKTQGVLRAFDVDSGKETSVQPACKSSRSSPDYADWITPLTLSPKGTDFYVVFGFFAKCAQRWDAQSLKLVWSSPVPDKFSASLDRLQPVFSADRLYLANDSDVLALAIDGGAARIAVTDPDYRFQVLATHGSDVIVQAKRQRGSTHYEIWAVNAASGQPHWKFDLGQGPPLKPGGIIDENQPMWLAQPAADGLRVVRFKSAADKKSYAILVDTLNWDTGQSADQKSTPLNIDTIILNAPEWTVWKNDTLWMATNKLLMAFDAAQNKIVYTWP